MNLSRKRCCIGHNELLCEACWHLFSQSHLPLDYLLNCQHQRSLMRLFLKIKLFICPNSTKGCAEIFKFSQQNEAKTHLESCPYGNLEEPNPLPCYEDEMIRTTEQKLNLSDAQCGYKTRFQNGIFKRTIRKTKRSKRRSFESNFYSIFISWVSKGDMPMREVPMRVIWRFQRFRRLMKWMLFVLKMPKCLGTIRVYQRIKGRGKIKLRAEDQNEKLELKCKNLNSKKSMQKLRSLYVF